MAIEEGKLIRETLQQPAPGRGRGPCADGSTRRRADGRRPLAEEIRRSIEANRAELGAAVDTLRGEVTKATDWRAQLPPHKREVLIGAAVAGFVVGGGIAAFTGLLTGRRAPALS